MNVFAFFIHTIPVHVKKKCDSAAPEEEFHSILFQPVKLFYERVYVWPWNLQVEHVETVKQQLHLHYVSFIAQSRFHVFFLLFFLGVFVLSKAS